MSQPDQARRKLFHLSRYVNMKHIAPSHWARPLPVRKQHGTIDFPSSYKQQRAPGRCWIQECFFGWLLCLNVSFEPGFSPVVAFKEQIFDILNRAWKPLMIRRNKRKFDSKSENWSYKQVRGKYLQGLREIRGKEGEKEMPYWSMPCKITIFVGKKWCNIDNFMWFNQTDKRRALLFPIQHIQFPFPEPGQFHLQPLPYSRATTASGEQKQEV